MAKLNELPDEVKLFVVQRLACWDTPSQVSKAVKEEFGIDLPRQNIHRYDPTAKAGTDLSVKLKKVFEDTREEFSRQTAGIGVAHAAVRLRRLDRMASILEERGNFLGAAQLLKQAAEDAGGSYTNKRELSGPDGTPLAAPTAIINLTGRPEPSPAREAVGRVPKHGK